MMNESSVGENFKMRQKPTKVTLVKDPQHGWYDSSGDPRDYRDDTYDGTLLIFEDYLRLAMGHDASKASERKKLLLYHEIGYNVVGSKSVGDNVRLYHLCVHDPEEVIIPRREILKLIDRWFKLVAAKTDKIIITNNDGRFSISADNVNISSETASQVSVNKDFDGVTEVILEMHGIRSHLKTGAPFSWNQLDYAHHLQDAYANLIATERIREGLLRLTGVDKEGIIWEMLLDARDGEYKLLTGYPTL